MYMQDKNMNVVESPGASSTLIRLEALVSVIRNWSVNFLFIFFSVHAGSVCINSICRSMGYPVHF